MGSLSALFTIACKSKLSQNKKASLLNSFQKCKTKTKAKLLFLPGKVLYHVLQTKW
jgi:hypothetical protein